MTRVFNVDEYRAFKERHKDYADLALVTTKIDNAKTSFDEILEREERGLLYIDPDIKDTINYAKEELDLAWGRIYRLKEQLLRQYTEQEQKDGGTEE